MIIVLQTLIDEEQEKMEAIAKAKSMDRKFRQYRMDWDTYHPLEDFYEYFDQLDVQSEDVSVENIGQSFEGRDMKVLKICKGGCGNKPIMYIEGGTESNRKERSLTRLFIRYSCQGMDFASRCGVLGQATNLAGCGSRVDRQPGLVHLAQCQPRWLRLLQQHGATMEKDKVRLLWF